jgi:hypothetical protein
MEGYGRRDNDMRVARMAIGKTLSTAVCSQLAGSRPTRLPVRYIGLSGHQLFDEYPIRLTRSFAQHC